MQCLNLGVIFLCGWLVSRLSEGRVWWPVAAFALMVFPGFNGAINLGQNPALSLALLLLGWWLMAARGRPLFGGAVWGLLAFKPVWAVAFFPALPLTGRWRAAAGMAVVGIAFAALTLPVVGFPVWLDWLEVGRLGSAGYDRDQSWIFLSRDLLGIPRRWLLSFEDNQATNPDAPLPAILGRALWLGCASITVALGLLRRRAVRSATGPGPAFVLLGAWLSCYHFMYYDVLLAALPLCLLFTEPARYLRLTFWPRPREPLSPALLAYYRPTLADLTPPPVPLLASGRTPRWVRNPLPPTLLALLIGLSYAGPILDPTWHFPPWDTFCLLALWAWCAARVLRAETPGEGGA
jgi:hypothetical protein